MASLNGGTHFTVLVLVAICEEETSAGKEERGRKQLNSIIIGHIQEI